MELPFSQPPGTPPEEAAEEDPNGAGARARPGEAGPVYCDLEHFEVRGMRECAHGSDFPLS